MKRKLVFATNNAHKLEEVAAILGDQIELLSLNDIDCHTDIPETADTLEGNALLKSSFIYNNYGLNCFADDTGLEVEALDGAMRYGAAMSVKSANGRRRCTLPAWWMMRWSALRTSMVRGAAIVSPCAIWMCRRCAPYPPMMSDGQPSRTAAKPY